MSVTEFQGEFRFLSNFWPSPIEYEGIWYPSVEHAYQAAKTLKVSDRKRIAKLITPGKAKRAGKELDLRPDWEEIKLDVMRELLQKKFAYRDLMFRLKKTEGELIEGNTWGDTFWGICNGKGENHLGKLLMEIRDN